MNERALGIYLLVALIVLACVHVVVAARLARASKKRGVLALLVPPLAPFYAWETGDGLMAIAWIAALAAYGVGVALA
ncbi:MAG: hypothetical protein IPF92_09225 [Myxococcales bacterium]|nr:hypothetical protein [Myxococcales bacterium]MBL0193082.1 hypothetical protein [Myxococcales bacterium]HQY62003.1 hypothetical protein [Polyangiaceae bacterium]